MASIDIGKLVQESIMTMKSSKHEESTDSSETVNFEGVNEKLRSIVEQKSYPGTNPIVSKIKEAGSSAKKTAQKYTGIGKKSRTLTKAEIAAGKAAGKAKESAGAAYAKAKEAMGTKVGKIGLGVAGLGAAGAAAAKGISAIKRAQMSKTDQLREMAKQKMDAAAEKAQGLGSHLKSLGSAAAEKIKENPKTAALAGTGAIVGGLALNKLRKMRAAKRAAA